MNNIIDFLLNKYALSDFKTKRKALLISMISIVLLLTNATIFVFENLSNGSETVKGLLQISIIVLLLFTLSVTYNRLLRFGVNSFLLFILVQFYYLYTQELYWFLIVLVPFFLLVVSIVRTSYYQIGFYIVLIIGSIVVVLANTDSISGSLDELYYVLFYTIIFCLFIYLFIRRTEKEIERSHEIIDQSTVDFILKSNNRRTIDRSNNKISLEDKISVLMIGINEIGDATSNLKDSDVNTLLKEVMNTIRNTVRVDDYIIRWGEAEFLVVLHYTHLSNSGIVAEKIRRAIEYRSFTEHKKRITITICATAKNEESGIQEAIDRAVEAMSDASTQNKNRVIFP